MIVYIWLGILTVMYLVTLVGERSSISRVEKECKYIFKELQRIDNVQKEEFRRKMEKKNKKRMKKMRKFKTVEEREKFLLGR